jgi:2-phospho-L-lactate guanylyltransferase (CobY/MobA/RfbA family)
VRRGLSAEGRDEEFGLPTFPSRRFVRSGGLTVVHEGLHEYELVDIVDGRANTMAITLLRSTGMLSRLGMSLRPLPAGPLTPVEGLQMVGSRVQASYGLYVGEESPFAVADDFLTDLDVVTSVGGGMRAEVGSALELTGAEVSAVRRVAGVLEVRVFNPSDAPTSVFSRPGAPGSLISGDGARVGSWFVSTSSAWHRDVAFQRRVIDTIALIPLRAWSSSKQRLRSSLFRRGRQRTRSRTLLGVAAASAGLPTIVVSDDHDVHAELRALAPSLEIIAPGRHGLDESLQVTFEQIRDRCRHVLVAHGDIWQPEPFAVLCDDDGVTICVDRHDSGTNVLRIPTSADWTFRYGPNSAHLHRAQAQRLGLHVHWREHSAWSLDVDTAEDWYATQRRH